MNAQQLLDFLINASQAGINLSELEVRVDYSVFDGNYFQDGETYPSNVQVDNNSLLLGPTPYNW